MFRNIVMAYTLGTLVFLYAQKHTDFYGMESGLILYDITGGGQLTPETNLSIEGKVRLRFKDWGIVKLEEESGIVLTTGAIQYKEDVKRFEKQTKNKIITVDYKNEKLLERNRNHNTIQTIEATTGLKKTSQENVAGLLCDVWEGAGVKKCIYKGIVLKLESDVLGMRYHKVATHVTFDVNTSDDACAVPEYPVHKFALFQDNIKTKNRYKVENFCNIFKNAGVQSNECNNSKQYSNILNKNRIKFINTIAQDIYKKQKKLLPEFFISMKKTRECLQTVENLFETNACTEHFLSMKEKSGRKEDHFMLLWNEKIKNNILDTIEDELGFLQSRMPCIKRSKNITDLSSCLK